MPQLPQNLDEAVAQAREATKAAIADGYTRLQVELAFQELKILPIATQFLPVFADLEEKLRVFFPDAGAAALARRDWGEQPFAVRGIGELKAKIQPEEKLFLFIEPSSVEVSQVEELCQEAGERPVVLLNPRMEDVATLGIGWSARQLRERFLNGFESCYYLKPLEGAALLRCYPSAWQVWLETDGVYELVGEEPQKPVGDTLDRLLGRITEDAEESRPVARKGFFSNLQEFLRALNQ